VFNDLILTNKCPVKATDGAPHLISKSPQPCIIVFKLKPLIGPFVHPLERNTKADIEVLLEIADDLIRCFWFACRHVAIRCLLIVCSQWRILPRNNESDNRLLPFSPHG
jgi:hypothetical protein